MKLRFAILIFFVTFVLQTTFVNAFSIFGVTPNLLLNLLICYLFFNKDKNGIILAALLGIVIDISVGQLVGVTSLALIFVYFAVVSLKENFNVENLVVAVPIGVFSTIIFDFVYFLIYKIFDSIYLLSYWMGIEIVRILYNLPVFTGIYLIFSIVYKGKKDRYRTWGRF
ncbi:MAG: rod shape-determining protein MreD [Eubacteriales bacterium]